MGKPMHLTHLQGRAHKHLQQQRQRHQLSWLRALLLALLATVGVYGLVAVIVRMDDVGLALMKRPQRLWQALGRGMVATLPWLIKAIGLLGTVALLLVAGDMIIHHVHMVHRLVETWPGALAATAVALVVGGVEVALVELVRRLK